MNKYLPAKFSAMLSNDQLAAAGMGHNMGDELETLGMDVKNAGEAIALAATFRAKVETTKGEASTAKVTALIATAQAAVTAAIKIDTEKGSHFIQLVKAFSGAKTDGSIKKEASILKRAIELQTVKRLVPTLRAAQSIVAECKDAGREVRALENVFESACSYARKNDAVPSLADIADKIDPSVAREKAEKAKAEKAAKGGENTAPVTADLTMETVAQRFVSSFLDTEAKNLDDASFDAELAGIMQAAKDARAALKAAAEMQRKAEEASSAGDVGGKKMTRAEKAAAKKAAAAANA